MHNDRLIKPLMFVNPGKREEGLLWQTDDDYQESEPRKQAGAHATLEVRLIIWLYLTFGLQTQLSD